MILFLLYIKNIIFLKHNIIMSEKTYTIKELKVMNSSTKWNHRIIIPSNANTSIKWKLQFTWENSGDLDGKYYKIIPYYYNNKKID